MHRMTFEAFSDWQNLVTAWAKASRGKRGKCEAAAFEYRLEENLLELQSLLQSLQWRPGGYLSFYIRDPKRRLISAAPFADRVVHHALCNVIEPVFERSFVEDSFANRVGKGNHRALNVAQQYARRFPYVLSLDIRKFFPCIDHAVLRGQLAKKIDDERLLSIIDRILESGADVLIDERESMDLPGHDPKGEIRPKGLPIGNLTSQFWANVYLNPLDHFIKRTLRCRGYVRYVDDMRLFGEDKQRLWEWKTEIECYLRQLRLLPHPGAHPRPVAEGFGFLGFQIFPDRRRIKKRKGIQYQRHLKGLLDGYKNGVVSKDSILDSVIAWNNHAGFGNTVGLRKKVFAALPSALADEARERYLRARSRITRTN
jgi:RNA-directed DNA polymerase